MHESLVIKTKIQLVMMLAQIYNIMDSAHNTIHNKCTKREPQYLDMCLL